MAFRFFKKFLKLAIGLPVFVCLAIFVLTSTNFSSYQNEQKHNSDKDLAATGSLELTPPTRSSETWSLQGKAASTFDDDADFTLFKKLEESVGPKDPDGRYSPDRFVRRNQEDQSLINKLKEALSKWEEKDLSREECPNPESLEHFYRRTEGKSLPADDLWDKFYRQINNCNLYDNEDDGELVDQLLTELATAPVVEYKMMSTYGTQIKLKLIFENGKKAVVKPMRFGRHHESDPDRFYYANYERHNAEIAAFHLDRILGIKKTVPAVGRVFNLTEMWKKAEKDFVKTFYISPVKNICFKGECDDLCDSFHPLCGSPDLKEGSVQVYLPDSDIFPREVVDSPYKRTYSSKEQISLWATFPSYCEEYIKVRPHYARGDLLLDLIDMTVLDFFTGNQDRHHVMSYNFFTGDPSYFILMDNGQGFGQPALDDVTILAPLAQCCVIRPSLLRKLVAFYEGPETLSDALYKFMKRDPVAPILSPKHYPGLERRLEIVLRTVQFEILSHTTVL